MSLYAIQAENVVSELITAELAKQTSMWGQPTERKDCADGELMLAGIAQLDALFDRHCGVEGSFDDAPEIYPPHWQGFRDYGSDVANIVVAIAFLTQEAKRKVMLGQSFERLSREQWEASLASREVITT